MLNKGFTVYKSIVIINSINILNKSPICTINQVLYCNCSQIKAALLPSPTTMVSTFATYTSHDLNNPQFSELFCVPIMESKLASKTLQVHVWCICEGREDEILVR